MRAALLLVAMLLVVTLAPGLAASQDSELILRVAMQDDMKGLNPLTVSDVWSWNVLAYIYDGPININPDTEELVPYIAVGTANLSGKADSWADCAIGNFGYSPKTAWENSSKQEAIIFYDFTNVKWHDDEQMDIRDVMFSMHMAAMVPEWSTSMNMLKDQGGKVGTNYSLTSWLHIYKVFESVDGMQAALKFRLQEPYADFFKGTLSTFLVPEHIWACTVSGQAVDHARIWCDAGYDPDAADAWKVAPAQSYSNNPPIGSGPFKFEVWEKGQYINVSTFRDHLWREDYRYVDYVGEDEYSRSFARQPLIDAITYKIFKTAEAAVLALKNDDIDYIAWSVPPAFTQELANAPGISLAQNPETGFFYMAYNMRKTSFGYAENGTDMGKPLRRAIAHCIDKERIVTRLLLNLGIAGTGPVPPFSEWYNASVPTYDFNTTKAKQILADAGYKVKGYYDDILYEGDEAVGMAGDPNWWYNPDGTPIGSGENGLIKILMNERNYDSCSASEGVMIAQQLRDIGIYAQAEAMDFGSIIAMIGSEQYTSPEERDFDMYILGWSIGSDPTDYLYSFFHSSQAAICYDLPYDVLYYRTNIEAYRSDRFVGWEVGSKGSIFNWESVYNIHPPGPWKATAMFVSPPSAVVSNSTTSLTVYVKDQDGNPISGATVKLNATAGKLSQETVNTSANGQATVMFTAPYANPGDPDAVMNGTNIIINIEAATYVTDDGTIYDPAPSRLTMVKVFPEGAEFLSVKMTADPDVFYQGESNFGISGFTYVDVEVLNQDGDPVEGASVGLSCSPAVLDIIPGEQLTDALGKARFKVVPANLTDDDLSVKEFTLEIIAIHPTDTTITGENTVSLYVIDDYTCVDPPPPSEFPVFETAVILFGILIAALAYGLIARRRR